MNRMLQHTLPSPVSARRRRGAPSYRFENRAGRAPGRHVAHALFSTKSIEGAGQRIKPHVPKHCACPRCLHGQSHLPLMNVVGG